MKWLVKIGGSLLDDPGARQRLAEELGALWQAYPQLVVVHGGGKQMTRYLTEHGVESRFVNGLRVTTPEVLDAVLKVFTGTVNRELVSTLIAAGVPAVGLSGIDGQLVEAEELDPRLGAVGRPVRSNPGVLEALLSHGYVPVVACVAGDRRGRIYNVNADQMAVACARAWGAERLVFLTDVVGVLDSSGNRISTLDLEGIEELVRSGVATGGMLAKLTAARAALEEGRCEVWIAPGAEPGILRRLLDGEALGTKLTR